MSERNGDKPGFGRERKNIIQRKRNRELRTRLNLSWPAVKTPAPAPEK